MAIALPITKITDPTITDIVLMPDIGYADDLFGDGIWGDISRGELPNLIDDSLTDLDDLVYRDGSLSFMFDGFIPFYLSTEDGGVPWFASDGENVRFEQDDSGTYLALSGESSETWISLDVIEAGASLTAEATFDVLYDYVDWDFLYYEASFSTTVSEDLSADFNDILTSVALTGGDVFGTDGDDYVYMDGADFSFGFGTDLSATYALGDGSDMYDLFLPEFPDSFDVTISDTGGDNDSLFLVTIGVYRNEKLDVEWVENPETGELDLVLTNSYPDFPGITPVVITVAGQGSNPDARIEYFDFGGFGTYTADELLEAFPLPFEEVTVEDTDDTKGWTSVTNLYSDDVLVSREMLMDDGRIITTDYEDGTRSRVQMEDTQDVYSWASLDRVYAEDGRTIVSENKVFDDGRVVGKSVAADGTETRVTTDGADQHNWATQETVRDADGALQSQSTTYDDGRVIETGYTDGVRSSQDITDTGDAFGWDSITRDFDANGQITQETRLLDDGRENVTQFVDGTRSQLVSTDVDDAYDWLTITTIYDETGAVEDRIVEDDPEEELALVI